MLTAEHGISDELKGAKGLPSVPNDQPGVLTLNVYHRGLVGITGTANSWLRLDAHRLQQVANHREPAAGVTILGGYGRNAHAGRLGAYAENAGTAFANYVYFYFVATYAEFEYRQLYRLVYRLPCPLQTLLLHRLHAPCPVEPPHARVARKQWRWPVSA